MSDFFRELAEQVPGYVPGALSLALRAYKPAHPIEHQPAVRKPPRREEVQAIIEARLARKAAS